MLTRDAIADLMQNTSGRTSWMKLQILDSNQSLKQISSTQRILLSDGKIKKAFKMLTSQSSKAQETLRQYDVIKVKIVFNPMTGSGTVTEFSIEDSGTDSVIGYPQDVENMENIRRINQARKGQPTRAHMRRDDDDEYMEIANLTPYDNDWCIRGRVIKKTPKRTFTGRDGQPGCVFNIHILDENNDRIQGVFFTEAANEYHDKLYMGKMYTFRGGDIKKVRNPRYNTTGNDLEIFFNRNSRIQEVVDSDVIPQFFYKFVPLSQIESIDENESVDILALVHRVGDIEDITLRSGEQRKKKSLFLIDNSGVVCVLTLWGEQAVSVNPRVNEIVGFAELKVRDFRGKQLSFSYNSKMIEDNLRDLPLYRKLMSERNRGVTVTKNISEDVFKKYVCKKIRQVNREAQAILNDNYESKETKLYFNVYGQISFVKEKIAYPSCHNDNCKKKVIKNFSEQYECARCNQTYDEPKRKIRAL